MKFIPTAKAMEIKTACISVMGWRKESLNGLCETIRPKLNLQTCDTTPVYFMKTFLFIAAICFSTFAVAEDSIGTVVSGSVTFISGESITIKNENGEKTLSVSSDTQVAGTGTSLADVLVGSGVAVRCNAGGSSALLIRVLPPPDEVVSGSVVSISENSLTLKTQNGEETFAVTPTTLIKNAATIGEIKEGANIAIRISADKQNVTLINAKPPQ